MRELTIHKKVIGWFKPLFTRKKKEKESGDEIKIEMCKRAVQSGVCPYNCDTCAWNTLK